MIRDWIEFAAVLGPVSFEEYYTSFATRQRVPQNPDLERRWQVHDLYISPVHRGCGIAKELGKELLAVVAEDTLARGGGANTKAWLVFIVNPKVTWLVDEYR